MEETYHARLIGPHGPSVCISKDLAMLETWVENDLVRESRKAIFIVMVRERVLKEIPERL